MRSLLFIAYAVLSGFALASPFASASSLEAKWMPLHAQVAVGVDGRVTAVTLVESTLSPAVRSTVLEDVKRWHFQPVLVDGVAVPALTYAYFDACAMPAEGGYSLAVHYIANGPLLVNWEQLDFSPSVIYYSKEHQLLTIKIDVLPDGHAQMLDVVMSDVDPRVQRDVRSAVKNWIWKMRFTPEQVGGHAVATELEWPMAFTKRPLGIPRPNVDPSANAVCKSARSAAAANTPHATNSAMKLQDDTKPPDSQTPIH